MFAIVDVETTGGSYGNDRITEIAILIHNGKKVIEEFVSLINPQKPIPPFITALTGISDDMVQNAPLFEDVAHKIMELMEGKILVAHNARFDYGMLRGEFRNLGLKFRKKQLCTVKLSRKIFPGFSSYSLGRLCSELDIEISFRHRAFGDAAATAILFERLVFNDKGKLIEQLVKDELSQYTLPANIQRSVINELPEEPGVYYFLNAKKQIIYVGKSNSIRGRVLSHFSGDITRKTAIKMKEEICDINYETTGNELAALLLESNEIKRYMPKFNRVSKRKKYRYGLTLDTDNGGYYRMRIELLNPEKRQVMKFTSKVRGQQSVESWQLKNGITPVFKKVLSVEDYNRLVDKALKKYRYPQNSFLMLHSGRSKEEICVVQVENKRYKGYGFTSIKDKEDVETLISCVKPAYDNEDAKKIIVRYLLKNKNLVEVVNL